MKPNYLFRVVFLSVFASVALTAQVARQESVVPLKNWAAPLYWQPSQAERVAAGGATPQLQFSTNAVSTDALTFVAITPCRLVDTRGAAAGFNGISPFSGPSIAAKTTVTFPVQSPLEASTDTEPAPCGVIPSIAEAYSLNLTVVPHAAGAVDYISMWPSGYQQPFVATLNDPQGAIVANAAIVAAGTELFGGYGGVIVYNAGPATADVIIDMNGYFAPPIDINDNLALGLDALEYNSTGGGNIAIGNDTLRSNTTGTSNVAIGGLLDNTIGNYNTAVGIGALASNTLGSQNTAVGSIALAGNTSGNYNMVSGAWAMQNNTTGSENTASGNYALQGNTTGNSNTAGGFAALTNNTTGGSNIAIGYQAALNAPNGNSNSIYIGSEGTAGDNSGTIAIGTVGTQTSAYIAGIYGGTPGSPNLLVCVDANGTLGTTGCSSTPSSRRFKEQIADMGDSSSKLFQLRPVTFLYKPEYDDGSHTLQYGLIAEEVAKLYPEMVGYDKDGQPSSVKYQSLAPMLLNEVQKLAAQNRKLEDRLAALEALLSSQTPTATRPASSQ